MKKHIYILSYFICISLFGYAQAPSDILNAYNQVVNTFKNYDIIPKVYFDGNAHYTLQPIKITYKYPNIRLSFNVKLKEERIPNEDSPTGTYTLVCPIATTHFSLEEQELRSYNYYLKIENSTGIEFINNKGKHSIIENYRFSGTKLTIKKICDEITFLQRLLIEKNYKDNLGIASSANTTNSPKSTSTSSMTYYRAAGFAIKNTYVLEENKVYREIFNKIKQTESKLIATYVCAQNTGKNDPKLINIININVNEITTSLAEFLEKYKRDLSANRISYIDKTWNGLKGIEYSFKQDMGDVMLPTKTFYGYKDNKVYLIQISSLTDCEKKYTQLLNSIKIL